ncbi:MAG TPA: sigma-54 dependent transcriptional regulator, partial [Rhodanobacteraceae bacterium]|nr:sigma-54 dependent transcriptional regulator [Rhodanobacteraceae bacterium]
FVPVNCGAIPSELMESEFFGHKQGSFTGAHADKDGLFHAAQGGTLFLDEVAELPVHMQVKLLRVIQEKAVRPIGARAELPVDVRILSATHKNLARLVELGSFRQDLFYRINVIELRVPPLRERREDIPKLAARVLERLAQGSGTSPARLAPDALKALLAYDFPGNVRELENVLERAVAMCEAGNITAEDLRLTPRSAFGEGVDAGPGAFDAAPARAASFAPPSTTPFPPSSQDARNDDEFPGDLAAAVAETERAAIMKALEATRWNRTAAAKQLGLTLRQLRYRLEKLGIE